MSSVPHTHSDQSSVFTRTGETLPSRNRFWSGDGRTGRTYDPDLPIGKISVGGPVLVVIRRRFGTYLPLVHQSHPPPVSTGKLTGSTSSPDLTEESSPPKILDTVKDEDRCHLIEYIVWLKRWLAFFSILCKNFKLRSFYSNCKPGWKGDSSSYFKSYTRPSPLTPKTLEDLNLFLLSPLEFVEVHLSTEQIFFFFDSQSWELRV